MCVYSHPFDEQDASKRTKLSLDNLERFKPDHSLIRERSLDTDLQFIATSSFRHS